MNNYEVDKIEKTKHVRYTTPEKYIQHQKNSECNNKCKCKKKCPNKKVDNDLLKEINTNNNIIQIIKETIEIINHIKEIHVYPIEKKEHRYHTRIINHK